MVGIVVCMHKQVQSNLDPFSSQKVVLPNDVAGLIRCTSDVVSMALVCAVCSIIESRGPSTTTYLHVHAKVYRWLAGS